MTHPLTRAAGALALLAPLATALLPATAQAAGPQPLDLHLPALELPGTDIGEGDPANFRATMPAAPGTTVEWVAYELTIEVHPDNFAPDAAWFFMGPAGNPSALTLIPLWQYAGVTGSITVGSTLSLVDKDLSFAIGNDGLLHLEIFDLIDDVPGAPDSIVVSGWMEIDGVGRLTVGAVPEPASWAAMALGLLVVGARLRRRA